MARNGLAHSEPYLWDGKYMVLNGRMVHRIVWESQSGIIPNGYLLHHKNGDRLDNRLENLEMMTLGEHCKLHQPSCGRLGYRSVTLCITCGNAKPINRRRQCGKCKSAQYRLRRKEKAFAPLRI